VKDKDGIMAINSLFDELKLTDFPDQVNQPTLDRLNEFLKGIDRPAVEAVTVRGLVVRMMKMNVPDGCQCWKVFDKLCMANVSHLSEEQRRTKRVLELQRVVVSCSRPIFSTMLVAYQEWGGAGQGGQDVRRAQPTQAQARPSVGKVGGGYSNLCYGHNEYFLGDDVGGTTGRRSAYAERARCYVGRLRHCG
jgi:hypothetical protein